MNWRKIKCYVEKEMEIIGVQRERGKPAMVLMADKGRYMGGAFVTFKADKRQALWDRVQGQDRRATTKVPSEAESRMAETGPGRTRQIPEGRGKAAPRVAEGFSRGTLAIKSIKAPAQGVLAPGPSSAM
ncbi:hypothetical protein ACVOMV_18180 [Mesorhizobium atlanticum]